jgi:hypothetical protein
LSEIAQKNQNRKETKMRWFSTMNIKNKRIRRNRISWRNRRNRRNQVGREIEM